MQGKTSVEKRRLPRRRRPGELEGHVMAALWAAPEPMTPTEVQVALGGDLAYATVATILSRLHAKGLVVRKPAGRAHHYGATVTETEFVEAEVRRLLERGDRAAVLQGFLDGLSPDDEQVLRGLLTSEGYGDPPEG